MAIWNTAKEDILFTDSLRGGIDVLNTTSGNIEMFAGKPRKENQEAIERDGCDGLSSVTHNFVFCLGLIERTRNLKLETLIKLLSDCKKFMNLKKFVLIM